MIEKRILIFLACFLAGFYFYYFWYVSKHHKPLKKWFLTLAKNIKNAVARLFSRSSGK